MNLSHIISLLLIYFGSFLLLTGSIGILRFPDFYTRLHPSGVADSLGLPCMVIGSAIYNFNFFIFCKAILIVLIMWITGTTSSQILSRIAYNSGLRPFQSKETKND